MGKFILCLACLEKNDPAAHSCRKCGVPLDNYSTDAPYQETIAEWDSALKQTTPFTKRQLRATWLFAGWIYPIYLTLVILAVFNLTNKPDYCYVMLVIMLPFLVYCSIVMRKAHKHYRLYNESLQDINKRHGRR